LFDQFDGTPSAAFEFSSGSYGSHASLYARPAIRMTFPVRD
jgi:hypothetical protein